MHAFAALSIVRRATALATITAAITLAGCAGAPRQSPQAAAPVTNAAPAARPQLSLGSAVAELAVGMVGARYRYGGETPSDGFDCSGLVYYAYTQAGFRVPRTSREQFRAAHKIALEDAGPGDLMFFQDQAKLAHVAIYLGDRQFVHAPADGQRVTVASIDSAYYQEHLVAVGRLLPH
jgi:cell wall-associated NlpC family hydrolase